MSEDSSVRPLHLHTVESLCADLISGRAVGVGTENSAHTLGSTASRSILNWYRLNRTKWASNVMERDAEAIVDVAVKTPPDLNATAGAAPVAKRRLKLVKVEAHQFGGLHAYLPSAAGARNFIFEPTKSITLFEGWNGSGKTSLLNAIIWCLTGNILRPQRKPEQGNVEFECRIERGTSDDPEATLHRLTPVSPMPDPRRHIPAATQEKLPIDTWVELTFVDGDDKALPPIRRTQGRNSRGAVVETAPELAVLGVDPIAVRMGTIMPGLIPFIQVGSVSELGQAVTQLTGLVELVDLARHATRVRQRIQVEFTKARQGEIDKLDVAFRQLRDELHAHISSNPAIAPGHPLPEPSASRTVEQELQSLDDHFTHCKTEALRSAQAVLGESFDPADRIARDDLENNIGSALTQLDQLVQLPSAARLFSLGGIPEEQLEAAAELVEEARAQAFVLAELATTPDLARRKQLYARVASWMKEHNCEDVCNCAVCGRGLEGVVDHQTGRLVRDHLGDALDGDADLMGHTVRTWCESWQGKFNQQLPETLHTELRKDLPSHPAALVRQAICDELFDTQPLKGTLSLLKNDVEAICDEAIATLPSFVEPTAKPLPSGLAEVAGDLGKVLLRLDRAIAFARWRRAHSVAMKQVNGLILGSKSLREAPVDSKAPLRVKLAALESTVKNATPIKAALQLCEKMARELKVRREKEHRITRYETAAAALGDIIGLGDLAERQVEDLRAVLEERAVYWRDRFYRNAYAFAGHALVSTEMDSKGTLTMLVGTGTPGGPTAAGPAQHIANSSALRASLMGFFMAFWEHVLTVRGGLKLLILDDPQELLDDDNRDRLARALSDFVQAGAQVVLTTHDKLFARIAVAEAGKKRLIEHKSVHPVNSGRDTVETAPAIESLDHKRAEFERHEDDGVKAQEYAAEARVFIEARLADLFDDPAYPAYSAPSKAPTLADHLCRLRGLVSCPPNDLFRSRVVVDFCRDPAVADGAACLRLLNTAHHNKATITYSDVCAVQEDLKRLRTAADALHGEFRRWRWREPAPDHPATVSPLQPCQHDGFRVQVYPDLAAFTGEQPSDGTQDTHLELFDSTWLDDKAFFFVKVENLGFAAPAGSVVIVECEPKPGNDRNLVIALRGNSIYARRLLRPTNGAEMISLAAIAPDPRRSPATLGLDPGDAQVHRILGVLFEDMAPPSGKGEAVQVQGAPCLSKVTTAYRVRDERALPLALPRQLVLGGASIPPACLDIYLGKPVAIMLTDGSGIFKRVGRKLPGPLASLRWFESIGGLGSSALVASEPMDGEFSSIPVMVQARQILGVLYDV